MGSTMRLNPKQQQAVSHPASISLVSCPGSGKTRTLVAKLVDAIDTIGNSTRLVACITYTNAAVHEIEARLDEHSAGGRGNCEVETIHSFCLKHIIGPHHWTLPQFRAGFSILGVDDPLFLELANRIVADFKLDRYALKDFEQLARGTDVYPETIPAAAAAAYWAELDRRGLIDFSGMIFWSAEIISKRPYVASGLASRYQWILVDEFQDTSALQVKILKAIHGYSRTLFFVVGDPFQSIMSVAGARPELLGSFGHAIGARSDIELLDNYRSSSRILRLADSICSRSMGMNAVGVNRDYLHEPEWRLVPNMLSGVADIFVPTLAKQGIELSNAAVLANRWTSLLPISRGLRDRRIPAIGPGTRPYKRSIHLIAPLVEELAAHTMERSSEGVLRIRRELRRLVNTITKGEREGLGFPGDVCAEQLIRRSAQLGLADADAKEFLLAISESIASTIRAAEFATDLACSSVAQSGAAMVADIGEHENAGGARTTTVRDLGLFAYGSSSLKLLTMHGSKGREYDAVALVDVFDGHVPFYKCKVGDDIEAEGRRLLYVAATRARKMLMIFTLTAPQEKTRPSRFLWQIFPKGPKRQA